MSYTNKAGADQVNPPYQQIEPAGVAGGIVPETTPPPVDTFDNEAPENPYLEIKPNPYVKGY